MAVDQEANKPIRVCDVIALPVVWEERPGHTPKNPSGWGQEGLWDAEDCLLVGDGPGYECVVLLDDSIARVVCHAINNFDQLAAENARLRAALKRIAEGEHDERLPSNYIGVELMNIAEDALKECGAQENAR